MMENELKRIADALEIIAAHYKQLDQCTVNEIDIVRTPTETIAVPRVDTNDEKKVVEMAKPKKNAPKKPVEEVEKDIETRTGNKELASALADAIREEEKDAPVVAEEPKPVEKPKVKKSFGKQMSMIEAEEEILEGGEGPNPFDEINNIDPMTIKSEVTPVEFKETKEEVPFEEPPAKPKATTKKKEEPKPVEKPKAKKSKWDNLDW